MKVKWENMEMVMMQAGGLLLTRRRQRAYAEQRINNTGYTVTQTDYIGNIIYENTSQKMILTPEGYYDCASKRYCYYLKDHLGSVRVVLQDDGTILEKNHYYPSGMRLPESTSNSAALPFRYGGKELESMNGLNQYDFGARRRSTALPIWTTPDPLAEKYYSISPYAFCENNFILNVDPNGESVHLNRIGDIAAEYDDGDDGVYTHYDLSDWDNKSTLAKSGSGISNIGELGGKINMTDLFENRLAFSKELAMNMSIVDFGFAVKSGSKWDLKSNWDTNTKKGNIWGYAWYFDGDSPNKTMFIFGDFSMTAADAGNFHYGFTGKYTYQGVGMPDLVLEAAAGAAEIEKNASESNYLEATKGYIQLITLTRPYGDRPIDNYWIRVGIQYAKSKKINTQ